MDSNQDSRLQRPMCYQLHHPGIGDFSASYRAFKPTLRAAYCKVRRGQALPHGMRLRRPWQAEFSGVVRAQVDARKVSPHREYVAPTRKRSVANPKVIDRQQFAVLGVAPKHHVRKVRCLLPGFHLHEFLHELRDSRTLPSGEFDAPTHLEGASIRCRRWTEIQLCLD